MQGNWLQHGIVKQRRQGLHGDGFVVVVHAIGQVVMALFSQHMANIMQERSGNQRRAGVVLFGGQAGLQGVRQLADGLAAVQLVAHAGQQAGQLVQVGKMRIIHQKTPAAGHARRMMRLIRRGLLGLGFAVVALAPLGQNPLALRSRPAQILLDQTLFVICRNMRVGLGHARHGDNGKVLFVLLIG